MYLPKCGTIVQARAIGQLSQALGVCLLHATPFLVPSQHWGPAMSKNVT